MSEFEEPAPDHDESETETPDAPDEEEEEDLIEAYESVGDAPVDEPPPDEGDAGDVKPEGPGDGKA